MKAVVCIEKNNTKFLLVLASSCLLFSIIFSMFFMFDLSIEEVKMTTDTVTKVVFADSNVVEEVQAEVVFTSPDGNVNTDINLFGIKYSLESAMSDAGDKYIAEKEKKLEEEKQRKLEEERKRLEEEQRARELREKNAVKIKGNAVLSYNPFVTSGLTVEQFNIILDGTGLEGCGQSYYNMEQTYGVNGIFAIGVAFHESAYGRARANTNNFYGMRGNNGWMAFESPDANIQYFGKLMNKSLYKNKSIDGIGAVYCPGTSQSWANKVRYMMSSSFDKL